MCRIAQILRMPHAAGSREVNLVVEFIPIDNVDVILDRNDERIVNRRTPGNIGYSPGIIRGICNGACKRIDMIITGSINNDLLASVSNADRDGITSGRWCTSVPNPIILLPRMVYGFDEV